MFVSYPHRAKGARARTSIHVADSSGAVRSTRASARAVRDAVMMQVVLAMWVANRKVYGAHKLWRAARRAGHDIGRDQVARLMRELGIVPNQRWVTDLTYVMTYVMR